MSAIRDAGRLGLRGSSPATAARIAAGPVVAGPVVAGKLATTEPHASYTARDVRRDVRVRPSATQSLGLVGAFLAGIVVGVALVVASLALGLAIADRLANGRDREVPPDNQTCGR